MAYIQPNSTVEFFPDIGLTGNYDDTLYFASTSAKDTYFSGLTKITTVNSLSYVRENRGFIRVERPMSTMYNVGYMRYKNTNFENKWFYAFVKSVNYINNITTEVEFEMDVIMTWMGAFTLKQCFIERQHTMTDAIGANIADEGLGLGEYVCEGSSMTAFFNSYKIGFYKTFNPDKDSVGIPGIVQGTMCPLLVDFYTFDSSSVATLVDRINDLVGDNRGDEILGLKLVPEHWCDVQDSTPPEDTFSVTKPYTTIAGYTPKNKKLFTFPYKYLEVENCEGESVAYKYEYFNTLPDALSSGEAYFKIIGTSCTPEVNIMCTPKDYNGEAYAWDDSVSMKNFPNVPWNVDGYKAYLAQRDSTIFGNILTKGISGAVTGATFGSKFGHAYGAGLGAIAGGIAGSLSGGGMQMLTDNANEIADSLIPGGLPARFPTTTKGNADSNIMVQSRNKNFYFRRMSITKNYAMMIDHYFDMFGYAIRQHGIPNMNARPYWTFVKTKGCIVEGNIPTDDARNIENIFDHGVRFWKNHTNIGNYNLSNAPA